MVSLWAISAIQRIRSSLVIENSRIGDGPWKRLFDHYLGVKIKGVPKRVYACQLLHLERYAIEPRG